MCGMAGRCTLWGPFPCCISKLKYLSVYNYKQISKSLEGHFVHCLSAVDYTLGLSVARSLGYESCRNGKRPLKKNVRVECIVQNGN